MIWTPCELNLGFFNLNSGFEIWSEKLERALWNNHLCHENSRLVSVAREFVVVSWKMGGGGWEA